jgi:endogenous inhibitor of DNA gyrase (YacG/DUF329 family)
MSLIFIKCPQTGRPVSTGIEIDRASFEALPTVGAPVKCPACGATHIWNKHEAWLAAAGEGYPKRPSS